MNRRPRHRRRGRPAVAAAALVALLAGGCADDPRGAGARDEDAGDQSTGDADAGEDDARGDDAGSVDAADPDDAVRTGASGLVDPPVPADVLVVRVVGISDGDTLRADVLEPGPGEGLAPGDRVRLRLLRIDAPEVERDDEVGECHAEAATDLLAELLPPGTIARAAYDVEQVDDFGRDLVHLWTPAGRWVNGRIVEAGLATVLTISPNTAYDTDVRAREAHARERGLGLWDPSTCPA